MNNHMMTLAFMFLQDIKGFPVDNHGKVDCEPEYKKAVITDVGQILAGGSVTPGQIKILIQREKENPNKKLFYKVSSILDHYKIDYVRKSYYDPENILVPGQFYLHPRLQITPPPPVIVVNDDGTFEASYDEDEFYLEIVDKITKKDLVIYFYNKMNSTYSEATLPRDIGAFEHMLKFWDVDFILYLIDEAFACSMDEGKPMPKTPLDIQQYEAQATAVYEARKRLSFEEGLDRVLPRSI